MYIWFLLSYMVVYVWLTVRGPSIWDRLLGMQLVSVKIVAILVVYASSSNIAFFLDVAIIYALFGFIATIFVTLFLMETRKRSGGGDITDRVSASGAKRTPLESVKESS